MLVGCPKEIKNQEYRVGLTPTVVRTLSIQNHKVLIEHNAESGSGFTDTDYKEAEARIVAASEIFKYA